ncbi:hypothetical protein M409DRAFT_29655 [Zasmidium cellare ATCC 36951]|uniref:Uncharacterized protein n=1 Tax=Zasmidium cellare ATCC 36951 TaxID=1080233 RepID=A0A6A6BYR5_ZASCE|nr:uncharacterized protein M409DRAFT_29655 [Zasmidium cellare ATCC 36951]KAF2159845.1 hypothetical protein M409DRAFT_29655 [Zasmidium cellare ATCC 36951]
MRYTVTSKVAKTENGQSTAPTESPAKIKLTAAATILFAASAFARIHTWCQCYVDDALNGGLSTTACNDWSGIWPNSHWDSNAGACADTHTHGGIDGDGWESTCQKVGVKAPYNLDIGAIRGHCWS